MWRRHPERPFPELTSAESEKMQAAFRDIAQRSQKFWKPSPSGKRLTVHSPPTRCSLTQTFMDFTAKLMADPNRLIQAQIELWQQYMKLWQVTAQRMMANRSRRWSSRAKGDKRFNDPAWKDEVVFDYPKQSYLLTSRWLQDNVWQVEGVDDEDRQEGRLLHPPIHRRDPHPTSR